MRSGFVGFFSNFFDSSKRDTFIANAEQTKSRITHSTLPAAKKKIFLAIIDYAISSKPNAIINFISGDNDINAKCKLLNDVLALSKKNDDDLITEVNKLLHSLPNNDESSKHLIATVNAASAELQQRRDTVYKIAAAIAALGSLSLVYFNPYIGTFTVAAEIAMIYTQDIKRLKPAINEVTEIIESGIVLAAIVDGTEKAREALAVSTFKP